MPVLGIELAGLVLLVVVGDLVLACAAQQLVALVHLDAEALQGEFGVLGVLHDGLCLLLFFVAGGGKYREVVLEELVVCRELDHLRVDEHELEFGRVLGVEERCDDDVEAYGLALLGGACNQEVGSVAEVEYLDLLGYRVADGHRQLVFAGAEGFAVEQALQRHDRGVVVGDFDSHRIRERDNADALGIHLHADVFLQFLDFGDAHAGGQGHSVKGDGGAYLGLDLGDFYLVVLERSAYLVVVALELFVRRKPAVGGVGFEKVEGRGLVFGKAFGRVEAVVDGRQFLVALVLQGIVGHDFESGLRLLREFAVRACPSIGLNTDGIVGNRLRFRHGLRHVLRLRLCLLHLRFLLCGGIFKYLCGVLAAEGIYPVGESAAAEEKPAHQKQEDQYAGDDISEKIVAPEYDLLSEFPSQAASEGGRNACKVTGQCEQQRCDQSSAKCKKGGLDKGEIPAIPEQAHAYRRQYGEQHKTAEAEEAADKQMPCAVSELAGRIAHFCAAFHH